MKKILVVDDSKTVLKLLRDELDQYNDIECFYAETYKEAMQIMREHHEELKVALLDINLPDAPDGQVISLANNHNIPAVVLTGSINEKIREILHKKDVASYILKDKPSSIGLAIQNVIRALGNYDTTILIVDDSKTFRVALRDIILSSNFNVLEAEDGQEALDIINNCKDKVSIVITDYEMPVMNGLDLTIKLREKYNKNEMSILAISSVNDIEVINDFLTFGADDFINKPFTKSEIIARINSSLHILEMFKEISDMANKDFLTAAYNRRYFFESGKNIFSKAKRDKKSIAIAMLDVDHFKNINDTYGHDIGDIAIKEIKKVLEKDLRDSDLIARFGGEEFCILLEDITFEDTEKLFEKIRASFENNVIDALGINISYTVSIGVAYGLLNSLQDMIKLADELLYNGKEAGRNNVTIKNI